jgi:alpha-tubulin suppressor-like RCC1 family protein
MTCMASHVVTQADVNSGSYVNTATGDSDQTTPNTSTVTVNFTPTGKPVTPPTRTRPSAAFTGFIPVTGGEAHAIAAGIAHTCAITPEGGVQCWGNNGFGQLGSGSNASSNIPVDVVGIEGGTTIVAGGNHTCVLSGDEVWCWGQNSQGQLGDGTRMDRNTPVNVLNNVADITAGLDYTCAIMNYGRVMCWGNNDQGQLADGTRTDRLIPTLAALISGLSNVDAGLNKSCGLTSAGLLKCLSSAGVQNIGGPILETGQSPETSLDVAVNRFGTLIMALNGEGVPVEFRNGKFKAINEVNHALDVDGGLGHVCTLLNDGTVKCWGSNNYGQLGINSKINNQVPQLVQGVSGAWQLAVGKYHACVLINSSTPGTNDIQCWGLNKDGQLGNGTNVDSLVPVFVK